MGKLIKNDLCSWSTASTKALFRFIQYSASVTGFGSRGAAASNPVVQNLLVIGYSPLPHQDVGVVSFGRILDDIDGAPRSTSRSVGSDFATQQPHHWGSKIGP